MALQEINLSFESAGDTYATLPKDWSHTGVVGSGDMEVLFRQKDMDGKVTVKIVTPVHGYDDVWGRVLEKFVRDNDLGDIIIEINDNNSTPYIVALRLKQALVEAREVAGQ